jgi:uncharacterized RDD family membrane protein YckC
MASSQTVSQSGYRAAPHGRRLVAWLLDSAFLAGALSILPHNPLFIAGSFIAYHGLLTWRVQRTLGKAVVGLKTERLGKPRSLLWAFGRSGIGYLITDFFGIGALLAFLNSNHQTAHDFVFGSMVTWNTSQPDSIDEILTRVEDFQKELETPKGKWCRLLAVFKKFLRFLKDLSERIEKTIVAAKWVLSTARSYAAVAATSSATAVVVWAVPALRDAVKHPLDPIQISSQRSTAVSDCTVTITPRRDEYGHLAPRELVYTQGEPTDNDFRKLSVTFSPRVVCTTSGITPVLQNREGSRQSST